MNCFEASSRDVFSMLTECKLNPFLLYVAMSLRHITEMLLPSEDIIFLNFRLGQAQACSDKDIHMNM